MACNLKLAVRESIINLNIYQAAKIPFSNATNNTWKILEAPSELAIRTQNLLAYFYSFVIHNNM